MATDARGRCPLCSQPGAAGVPCASPGCRASGVHVLPERCIRPREQHRPEVRGLVGTAIDGRYLITELAGRGGFGSVYVALALPDLEAVAVKVMTADEDAAVRGKQLGLFAREIEALARLSHPNIVRYRDSGDYEGVPYFAMEYIAGSRTLSSEIKARAAAHGDFTPAEVCRVVTQTAAALAYAHGHALKIIHRDLKPDNLMLVEDPNGHGVQVKVLDFGLAKYVAESTRTAQIAGTARYMAPEQFRGSGLGPATDLYALACVAIELITRQPAFPGEYVAAQKLKANPEHDPMAGYGDLELDPEIDAFFRKALAFDAKARFATAEAFSDAFEQMIGAVSAEVEKSFAHDLVDLLETTDRVAVLAALAQKERELAGRESRLAARERELDQQKATVESERRALQSTTDVAPRVPQPAGLAEPARQDGRGAVADELDDAPDELPIRRTRRAAPTPGTGWLDNKKLWMLAGMLALIALVAGTYSVASSNSGSSRRDRLLAGVAAPDSPPSEPKPSADPADLGLGRTITSCFHPTGVFVGIALGEPEEADDVVTSAGSVEFRGALTENRYRMEFRVLVRKVDGKLEMKVVPTADTALFPPSPDCRLRSWTEFDD